MLNLKNTSPFKWLIFIFLVFVIFRLIMVSKETSKISDDVTFLSGKLITKNIDGNFLSGTILTKEKEKVNFYYYLKTEQEQKLLKNMGFGDILYLKGDISLPQDEVIFNTFSFKKYLFNHRIFKIMNVSDLNYKSTKNFFYYVKNKIYNYLDKIDQKHYLRSLLIGEKKGVDYELLSHNGISHLFAVSGIHIAIFIDLFYHFFYKKCRKHSLILIAILWFYTFLVGFTISIVRSVLNFTIITLLDMFNLKITTIKSFIITSLIIIIKNPLYLFDASFLYSFLITLGLILSPSYKKQKMLKISLLTFFLSAGLTCYFNYEINFLAIFFNIIATILIANILYPFAILCLFFPFLINIFNYLFNLFLIFNKAVSKVSVGVIVISKYPYIIWVIYYFILFFYLVKKQKLNYYLGLYLLILAIIPRFSQKASVTFLDVGQGDAIAFISPNKKEAFLIDTGGKQSFFKESWQQRKQINYQALNIATYFKSEGVSSIFVITSHGDYDHLGNLIDLSNYIHVNFVVLNENKMIAKEQEIGSKLPLKKLANVLFKYFKVKQLNPLLNQDDENDASLVLEITNGYLTFLMMGDAPKKVEEKILNKVGNVDFIKLGHHGSNTSSNPYFLSKIKPQYAFISAGQNNRYHHPHQETINTLAKLNIPYYNTQVNHSIKIIFQKDSYHIKPLSGTIQ